MPLENNIQETGQQLSQPQEGIPEESQIGTPVNSPDQAQQMERFLGPKGSRERLEKEVTLEKIGVPVAQEQINTPTIEEAFPFEQGWVEDFGRSMYNEMYVENFGGLAQMGLGLGRGIFKLFGPDDFYADVDDAMTGWEEGVVKWKENNRAGISDAGMKIGAHKDELLNANWLGASMGSFVGFMGAAGLDVLLARGAGTVARLGKTGTRAGQVMRGYNAASPTLGGANVKKYLDMIGRNTGKLRAAGVGEATLARSEQMLSRAMQRKGAFQKNILSPEEWANIDNVLSSSSLVKNYRKSVALTSMAGMIYGSNYEAAMQAGLDPEQRTFFSLAMTVPMASLMYLPFGMAFQKMMPKGLWGSMSNAASEATKRAAQQFVKGGGTKGIFYDSIESGSKMFGEKWWNPYMKKSLQGAADTYAKIKTQVPVSLDLTQVPTHAGTTASVMGLTSAVDALGKEMYDSYFADSQARVGSGKFGSELLSGETAKHVLESAFTGALGGGLMGMMGGFAKSDKAASQSMFRHISELKRLSEENPQEAGVRVEKLTKDIDKMSESGLISAEDNKAFKSRIQEIWEINDESLWGITDPTGRSQWQAFNLIKLSKQLSNYVDVFEKERGRKGSKKKVEAMIPELNEILAENGTMNELLGELNDNQIIPGNDPRLKALTDAVTKLKDRSAGKFGTDLDLEFIDYVSEAGDVVTYDDIRGEGAPEPESMRPASKKASSAPPKPKKTIKEISDRGKKFYEKVKKTPVLETLTEKGILGAEQVEKIKGAMEKAPTMKNIAGLAKFVAGKGKEATKTFVDTLVNSDIFKKSEGEQIKTTIDDLYKKSPKEAAQEAADYITRSFKGVSEKFSTKAGEQVAQDITRSFESYEPTEFFQEAIPEGKAGDASTLFKMRSGNFAEALKEAGFTIPKGHKGKEMNYIFSMAGKLMKEKGFGQRMSRLVESAQDKAQRTEALRQEIRDVATEFTKEDLKDLGRRIEAVNRKVRQDVKFLKDRKVLDKGLNELNAKGQDELMNYFDSELKGVTDVLSFINRHLPAKDFKSMDEVTVRDLSTAIRLKNESVRFFAQQAEAMGTLADLQKLDRLSTQDKIGLEFLRSKGLNNYKHALAVYNQMKAREVPGWRPLKNVEEVLMTDLNRFLKTRQEWSDEATINRGHHSKTPKQYRKDTVENSLAQLMSFKDQKQRNKALQDLGLIDPFTNKPLSEGKILAAANEFFRGTELDPSANTKRGQRIDALYTALERSLTESDVHGVPVDLFGETRNESGISGLKQYVMGSEMETIDIVNELHDLGEPVQEYLGDRQYGESPLGSSKAYNWSKQGRPFESASDLPVEMLQILGRALENKTARKGSLRHSFDTLKMTIEDWTGSKKINTKAKLLEFIKKYHPDKTLRKSINSPNQVTEAMWNEAKIEARVATEEIRNISSLKDIKKDGGIEFIYGDKATIVEGILEGSGQFELRRLFKETTGEAPEKIDRQAILDALQSDAFQESITGEMIRDYLSKADEVSAKPSKSEVDQTIQAYKKNPELLKQETGLEDINELPHYVLDFQETRIKRSLDNSIGKLRHAESKLKTFEKNNPDTYSKFMEDANRLEAIKKKRAKTKHEIAEMEMLSKKIDPLLIEQDIKALREDVRKGEKVAIAENIALEKRLDLAQMYEHANDLPGHVEKLQTQLSKVRSMEPTFDRVKGAKRYLVRDAMAQYTKTKLFKENHGTLEDMDLGYLRNEFGVESKNEIVSMMAEHINPDYAGKSWYDIMAEDVMQLGETIERKSALWEMETIGTGESFDLSTQDLAAIEKTFGKGILGEESFLERGFGLKKQVIPTRKYTAQNNLTKGQAEAIKTKATDWVNKYGESLPTEDKNVAIRHIAKFEDMSRGEKINGLDTEGYARKLTESLVADAKGEKVSIPWIRDTRVDDLTTGSLEGKRDYQYDAAERALDKLEQIAMMEPYSDPSFVLVRGKSLGEFIEAFEDIPGEGSFAKKSFLKSQYEDLMSEHRNNFNDYKKGKWEGEKAFYQPSQDGAVDPRVFGKIKDNPETFKRITDTLKTIYPDVKIKQVPTIKGGKKAGKAIPNRVAEAVSGAVEWSVQDGRLDTVPHEYSHLYIDAFRRDPLMVKAFEQISKKLGTKDPKLIEEELATILGEQFTEKVGKINRGESTWETEMKNPVFRMASEIWSWIKSLFSQPQIHKDLRTIEESFHRGSAPSTMYKRTLAPEAYTGFTNKTIDENYGWKRDQSKFTNPTNVVAKSIAEPAEIKSALGSMFKKKAMLGKFDVALSDAMKNFGPRFSEEAIVDLKTMSNKSKERILRKMAGEEISLNAEENSLKYNAERMMQMARYAEEIKDSYLLNDTEQSHYKGIGKQMIGDIAKTQAYYETISDPKVKGLMRYMYSGVNLAQSHMHNVSKLLFGNERSAGHTFLFGQLHEGNRMKDSFDGEVIQVFKDNYSSTKKFSSSWNRDIDNINQLSGKEISIGGGNNKMFLSDGEIASLYMQLRQNKSQIVMKEKGGAVDPSSGVTLNLKNVAKVKGREKIMPFKLTSKEADAIESYVNSSPEMKKLISATDLVMAKAHKFADPIHQKLTGVGIPKRKNFFPMYRDAAKELMEPGYNDLSRASFARQRKVDAKAPIEIADILDHTTAYTNNVRNFASFSIPIRNIKKMLASPEYQDLQFSDAVGSKAKEKMTRFLENQVKEIEDPGLLYELVRNKTFLDKMLGTFPKVALGYNVWVSTKQAASYFMANSNMDMKHLLHGADQIPNITAKGFKTWAKDKSLKDFPEVSETIQKSMKYSPLIRQRIDGSVQRQTGERVGQDTNYLTGEDIATSFNVLGKRVKVNPLLRSSRVMDWIKIVDTATIAGIWKASESEVRSVNPKLKGDAFYEQVARRAEDIVMKTQPTFNSVWRTGIRREKGLFWKGLNMFTSQVTKNYNTSMDSLFDYYVNGRSEKNKSKVARTLTAGFLAQPLYLGAISTLQGMMYGFGDEEDKFGMTARNALSYSTGNIVGGRVVYKALSGDVGRSVEMINPLIDVFQGSATALKYASDRDLTQNVYSLAREGAAFFGVPKSPLTMGNAIMKKLE